MTMIVVMLIMMTVLMVMIMLMMQILLIIMVIIIGMKIIIIIGDTNYCNCDHDGAAILMMTIMICKNNNYGGEHGDCDDYCDNNHNGWW